MPDTEREPLTREQQREVTARFFRNIPYNQALGVEILELAEGLARLRLPYDAKLVGDPERGLLHGGVITAMLDACCGAAAFMALPKPEAVATLELRIDYLKPATPGEVVLAEARCFKLTRSVVFTRAEAFHEDSSDPIAAATGTFMRGSYRPSGERGGPR